MSDASTKRTCGEDAAYRYTWPGRDESFVCEDHAVFLRKVAAALGMHLQLIPIAPNLSRCTQKLNNSAKAGGP